MRTVDAGTGDEIAACMKMMLQEHEGLWQNTRCLITDRCPAQVSANRKIVALMNQDRDATNQVYQVACLMHTVLGSDNRSGACLSEDTIAVGSALKQIFGGRKQDCFRYVLLNLTLSCQWETLAPTPLLHSWLLQIIFNLENAQLKCLDNFLSIIYYLF